MQIADLYYEISFCLWMRRKRLIVLFNTSPANYNQNQINKSDRITSTATQPSAL